MYGPSDRMTTPLMIPLGQLPRKGHPRSAGTRAGEIKPHELTGRRPVHERRAVPGNNEKPAEP